MMIEEAYPQIYADFRGFFLERERLLGGGGSDRTNGTAGA
jgi:hypothetical protein